MRITFELLKATSKQIARRDEDEKSFLRRLTHLFLQAKGVSAPSNALYGGSELLMATADAGRIKVWSSLMGWRTSQTSRRALHSQSQLLQLLRRRCERARVWQTLYAYDNKIPAITGLEKCKFVTHLYLQVRRNASHHRRWVPWPFVWRRA